jgi:hypothetical protein
VIDQLSFDPTSGFSGVLPGDQPTLLAWGEQPVIAAESRARRSGASRTCCTWSRCVHDPRPDDVRGDLVRSSAVDVNANFFSKDPWTISFGIGDVRMVYRPCRSRAG